MGNFKCFFDALGQASYDTILFLEIYEPFDVVTRRSLLHALKENGISHSDEVVQKIMDEYNVLPWWAR